MRVEVQLGQACRSADGLRRMVVFGIVERGDHIEAAKARRVGIKGWIMQVPIEWYLSILERRFIRCTIILKTKQAIKLRFQTAAIRVRVSMPVHEPAPLRPASCFPFHRFRRPPFVVDTSFSGLRLTVLRNLSSGIVPLGCVGLLVLSRGVLTLLKPMSLAFSRKH